MFPLIAGAVALGLRSRRRRKKRRKKNATKGTPYGPNVFLGQPPPLTGKRADELRAVQEALEPTGHRMPPKNTGYILITDMQDPEETYLGRNLDFDVNKGFLGKGETEKVLLDGHVIWETQLRWPTEKKLVHAFIKEFDIQQVTASQVANILAESEDDPMMFGETAKLDSAMEAEMDDLRAELEAEYEERFEEDYQRRLKQEYPGMFSQDFKKHYNDMVQDELDDSVDSHEDLYHEYIVTPKHIRYKR